MHKCQFMTKKGKGPQCKRDILLSQTYCYQHQGSQSTTVEPTTVDPKVGCQTIQQILAYNPTRSVWSAILEQNQYDKTLLDQLVNDEINKKQFRDLKSQRLQGQWQFGMESYNIRAPKFLCKHACTYCYIGPMFARFGRHCQSVDIEDLMPTDPKLVNHNWTRAGESTRKMIFFPSSSDIFVENARDYVCVCKKIIDAGHEVFFATKPSMKSMSAIVEEFDLLGKEYKSKLFIFVTITADDNKILRMFEPHAPLYEERVNVIQFLVEHEYNVNVMMEPYLVNPIPVIDKLLPMIDQGIIAIGGMNYTPQVKFTDDPVKNVEIREYLNQLYQSTNIQELYEYVKLHPNVYLKHLTIDAIIKLKK